MSASQSSSTLRHYCEVIIPVPLEQLFTYSVPNKLYLQLKVGMRVRVPFGKTKVHTAIVCQIHQQKPAFETKDIIGILDDKPIVLDHQLKLWQWIANYYMAPIGDVMVAALPAKLKGELQGGEGRPETFISLGEKFSTPHTLNMAFGMIGRAPKQQKVLETFLQLTGCGDWKGLPFNEQIIPTRELTLDELRNECNCTLAVINELRQKNILASYQKRVVTPPKTTLETVDPKPLNRYQEDAYNQILMGFLKKNVVLLHGVTASGKTEIYIHLIEKTLQEGKQVLYLLPEIALTVQITNRLQQVFGNKLGIYHSRCTDEERNQLWQKQVSGHPYDIILGARSAVFLPMQNLGLIIVDEEHDASFKQQEPSPRYHARSVALMMGVITGAKTLLGTATPSIESYYNATEGQKYALVKLNHRHQNYALPSIEIIDTKDLRRRKMMKGVLSPPLIAAIRSALDKKQQVILFQNRRGYAPMLECKTCGWVPKCEHCDVSLTYHKTQNWLTCHYCGAVYPIPQTCPSCEESHLVDRGFGTEKVEDEISALFPDAKLARMDLDTTRSKRAYERLIDRFSSGEANLLIGTQMVTKGLDFKNVAVVGILNADQMLNMPDFRAYEYAFMMLSQVSGRAGRGGEEGKVFLQTAQPQLPLIQQVVTNDYTAFYESQQEERRLFSYPPFNKLLALYLKHSQERVVEDAAKILGSRLKATLGVRVLGPDKPAVSKVKTMHIRKMVIKIEKELNLTQLKQYLYAERNALLQQKRFVTLRIFFDMDPC